VAKKLPLAKVRKARRLPNTFDGFRVDIEETDTTEQRTTRRDPVRPGISVGPLYGGGAGTVGLIVNDKRTGNTCFLSARHVLYASTTAMVQPAVLDGGTAADVFAKRLRSSRNTDAAIAELNNQRGVSSTILGTGVDIYGLRWPRLGDTLAKSGKATGITRARVTDIGNFYPLPAAFKLTRIPGFPASYPVSAAGDSGAVWYDESTYEGVGLHVKGASDRSYAIATFLKDVFLDRHLDISL
jgi:hypothetical protein